MKYIMLIMCHIFLIMCLFIESNVHAADMPAIAKDVADVYKLACTRCHGANGEGDKNLAPALKGNQFVTNGTGAEVASIIKDGRYGAAKKFKDFPSAMPAQNGSLSDGEIGSLVNYIKTDLQK